MAQWRKVVVSGSSAVLNEVSASGNIVPKTTDGSSLGTAALQFSDLFLGEGAVINWDSGDFTATQTNNLLALSGGNTRVDRLEVDSANDYVDVDTDLKVVAAADITLDPGGNNVKPGSDNADALGVSGTAWSDLFLGDGAVINFNAGDVTATHSSNLLSIAGGNTRVIRLEIDSASDYLDVSTDLQVIAAADITLDPAGGNVKPASNDDAALGVAGTGWSDLFLAEGAVINWDSGDFTATQANNLLTLSGGNTRVDRLELDSASDYLDVDTDLKIVANADISLEPGGSDVLIGGNRLSGSAASTGSFGYLNVHGDGVFGGDLTFGDAATDSVTFGADISSNLLPNTDDTYDLGSASQAWQDLFLEGDITLTDAGTIATTAGALTLTSAAAATWSTSAGNLTLDSAAGTLVLDGHTGVNIDASNSGKVAIDGAGGIDIGVAADVAIDVDSSTFDLDASGALTMTSTTMAFDPSSTFDIDAAGAVTIDGSSITLGGDSDVAFDIDTSTLDIDSSGAITIDSTAGVSIDAGAASNLSTTAGALTLDGAGGINIGTAGNVAVDFNSSTFDLDAAGAITIDGTSTFSVDAQGATNIDTTSGAISIGTANSGIAISIGHSTSETTINDNLTITGNLTVNGDQTIVSTTNLAVEDKFAVFASGSTSATDGGIIVSKQANGAGFALGYDTGTSRWVLDDDLAVAATNIVPDAFVGTVELGTTHGDSQSAPTYGSGVGSIYVDTDDNEIWIYA